MEIKLNDRQVKILTDLGRGIEELQQRRNAVLATILASADEDGPAQIEQRDDGLYLVRPKSEPKVDPEP